jgi:hypothetical protein
MPGSMTRSAPQSPFELPEVTPAARAASLSCQNAGKEQKSRRFGSHPGNPGLTGWHCGRRRLSYAFGVGNLR